LNDLEDDNAESDMDGFGQADDWMRMFVVMPRLKQLREQTIFAHAALDHCKTHRRYDTTRDEAIY